MYAQRRETEFAEDQDIVEDDVAQHHDEGVERERAGVGGADVEGAENEGDEGKGDARHAPRQVDIRGVGDFGRVDETVHQVVAEEEDEGHQDDGK